MLEIGSVLDGKYKILSEIGHGGMSVVYMALNEKANKTWAVKEIRKNGKLDFSVVRQGLVAELETLKKLNHPYLPSIIDVIEDEDTFVIVMDYIEGNSLDKSLAEFGPQDPENVIEWAKQLCDVLGYLHSCKPPIIYRDMKPANIMLKPDGTIALIDFGTAKTYDDVSGQTTGIGTKGYAAPEQYIDSGLGRTDARTDIYCLGVTLYHLLTGIDPCKNVIKYSLREVNPSLPAGLDEIISKCMELDPDDRYQACDELLYALQHYDEMTEVYRSKQRKKLSTFILTSSLSVFFAVISVAGFFLGKNLKASNYDGIMARAGESGHDQKYYEELYKEAISIDPTKKEAYELLLELYLQNEEFQENDNEKIPTGKNLSTTEASSLYLLLSKGVDGKNSDGINYTYPALSELKREKPDDYEAFCDDVGFACWYDLKEKIENTESIKEAEKWFSQAPETDSMAKTFCEISECLGNIERYRNRSQKKYKFYEQLLELYFQQFENVSSKDDDIKVKVYNEEVKKLNNDIAAFLEAKKNSSDDIVKLLTEIRNECEKIKITSDISEIRNSASDIIIDIDNLETKLSSIKNKTVSGGETR